MLKAIIKIYSAIAFFIFPLKTYATNLYLEFFARNTTSDNVFSQTPGEYDGKFFFIKDKKLFLFDRERISKPIEIILGSNPISEIVKNGNFLFCSDDSKIIEISKFGIEKKLETPFPCVSPPLKSKGRIYSIDLKSNICMFSESEQKCVKLKEEKYGEIKLIGLSPPKIHQFRNQILVPYDNELFVVSDDLRTRYKILEFGKSDFINSTKIIGNKLYISTQEKITVFEINQENEVLKLKELSNVKIKYKIIGADFDEDKIAFTYEKGFGVIKNKKIFLKPIRGIIDISHPIIYGDYIFFVAQFGEKVGRIFGPRKNSIITVLVKSNGEPIIKNEYIIHSFARILKNSSNRLYFLTEDSTLYVFRIFREDHLPNL